MKYCFYANNPAYHRQLYKLRIIILFPFWLLMIRPPDKCNRVWFSIVSHVNRERFMTDAWLCWQQRALQCDRRGSHFDTINQVDCGTLFWIYNNQIQNASIHPSIHPSIHIHCSTKHVFDKYCLLCLLFLTIYKVPKIHRNMLSFEMIYQFTMKKAILFLTQ